MDAYPGDKAKNETNSFLESNKSEYRNAWSDE